MKSGLRVYGLALVVACLLLSGCSGVPLAKPPQGSLSFALDLSALRSAAQRSADPIVRETGSITITGVTVTLTRSGLEPITANLTVANNAATGQVDGLLAGYWNVSVVVYQNSSVIYSGDTDVNVVAGAITPCTILLDPAPSEPPTQGSIVITVGVNPVPGYRPMSQVISQVLVDQANEKLYMLDSSTGVIAVYNAATLNRERDYTLSASPLSIAFSPDRTGILLGYPTGSIYLLNLTSGATTLVGDALMEARLMTAFGDRFVLVASSSSSYSSYNLKALNLTTGQMVDSMSSGYTPHLLEYNPVDGTVYFFRVGVTPYDLHRIRLNAATGDIVSTTDSPYHGDYSMGTPIRVIKNGSRVITSAGTMFTCSSLDSQDLLYAGNLGYSYIDLAVDDAKGYLYALGNQSVKKLLVFGQTDLFLKTSVELAGTPKQLFSTANNVVVQIEYQGRSYLRSWSKTSLGV